MHGLLLWLVGIGFGGVDAPQQCTDLKLSANSARPTHYVEFEGVSPEIREAGLLADFRAPGRDELFPTDLSDLGDDRGEFLVILHPINGLGGGPVELVFTIGELQCPGLPFTIEPMSPALGVLAELAESYDSIIATQVELLGGPTDGSPMPPDAPDFVQDLGGILDDIRGGPDRPSLRDAMSAFDPATAGTAGALLQEAGAPQFMSTLAAGMTAIANELAAADPQTPSRRPDISFDGLTPEGLEYLLELQMALEGLVTGDNRTAADMTAVILSLSAGVTSVGVASGVGAAVPVALGKAAAIVGQSVSFAEFLAGMLPNKLDEIVLTGQPTVFEEDHPLPEGRWAADLYASSKGYKLDYTTVLGFTSAFKRMGKYAGSSVRGSKEVQDAVASMTEAITSSFNTMESRRRGIDNEAGLVEIRPLVYGPVGIEADRDEDLMRWQISSRAFALDADDPHTYRGLEAGLAVLVVATRNGRFAGQSAFSTLDLEVRPIIVTIFGPDGGRGITYTTPNKPVSLQATVQNAIDPCLRWSARNGGILVPPSDCRELSAEFSAAEKGDYLVEAESMTRTGIRASANPKRSGGITVRVGGLRLAPSPRCVEVGETVRFEALKWEEPVTYSMMFEAIGGTIDPDGTFTATIEGPGRVRVTDPEEPDLTDEVTFDIEVECPGWTMTLTGPVSGTWQGYCADYTDPNLAPLYLFTLDPERERPEASPFMYRLVDEAGNQVFLVMDLASRATTKADGSVSQATGQLTFISLSDQTKVLFNADLAPGLTVEHTAKPDLQGSGWLLAGSMSGVVFQFVERNGQVVLDETPIDVKISFKRMGNNGYEATPFDGPMTRTYREAMARSPVPLPMSFFDEQWDVRCQPSPDQEGGAGG